MLAVGEYGEFSKTISESDVYTFAGITGDFNSVHVNKVVAERSRFGKQIAHGILVTGLVSTVIGTVMPGEGTVYMEQDIKFLKPVYIGDTVTAKVTVADVINEKKGVLKLSTTVINQDNEIVCDGFAVVMVPQE
jgi:3-hydroxybutyryl-CoA dehydratase